MNYYRIILIAVSLSIDAFSLSLAYGLMNYSKRKILYVSTVVGVFHFIMPLLGFKVGKLILKIIAVNPKIILLVMFSIVILEMIKGLKEEATKKSLDILGSIIFALLVSIDSFSVGIGMSHLIDNIFLSALTFSLSSFVFTILGFYLGKYFSLKIKKYSKLLGILMMFTLLIYYLCK